MPKFSRQELEQALEIYNEKRDRSSRTGDWSIWASLFTEDADYVEHAYGEFKGRAEIQQWITDVMAPFPHMRFPQSWVAFDEDTGTITIYNPARDAGRVIKAWLAAGGEFVSREKVKFKHS